MSEKKMGRKKIKITKIKKEKNRIVTFNKRKVGLMKKAIELSILCDLDVAVVVFTKGRVYEFCSKNIDDFMLQYANFEGPAHVIESGHLEELCPGKATSFKVGKHLERTVDSKRWVNTLTRGKRPRAVPVVGLSAQPPESAKRRKTTPTDADAAFISMSGGSSSGVDAFGYSGVQRMMQAQPSPAEQVNINSARLANISSFKDAQNSALGQGFSNGDIPRTATAGELSAIPIVDPKVSPAILINTQALQSAGVRFRTKDSAQFVQPGMQQSAHGSRTLHSALPDGRTNRLVPQSAVLRPLHRSPQLQPAASTAAAVSAAPAVWLKSIEERLALRKSLLRQQEMEVKQQLQELQAQEKLLRGDAEDAPGGRAAQVSSVKRLAPKGQSPKRHAPPANNPMVKLSPPTRGSRAFIGGRSSEGFAQPSPSVEESLSELAAVSSQVLARTPPSDRYHSNFARHAGPPTVPPLSAGLREASTELSRGNRNRTPIPKSGALHNMRRGLRSAGALGYDTGQGGSTAFGGFRAPRGRSDDRRMPDRARARVGHSGEFSNLLLLSHHSGKMSPSSMDRGFAEGVYATRSPDQRLRISPSKSNSSSQSHRGSDSNGRLPASGPSPARRAVARARTDPSGRNSSSSSSAGVSQSWVRDLRVDVNPGMLEPAGALDSARVTRLTPKSAVPQAGGDSPNTLDSNSELLTRRSKFGITSLQVSIPDEERARK